MMLAAHFNTCLQLAGRKVWRVRPLESSAEWGGRPPMHLLRPTPASSHTTARGGSGRKRTRSSSDTDATGSRLTVVCEQGDFLLINTRLWWHATCLPVACEDGLGPRGALSMSFARDFYCARAAALLRNPPPAAPVPGAQAPSGKEKAEAEFTNVDGIYASRPVRRGHVVLRESELPDCALPRSRAANCEVAVDAATGEGCLVATKNIRAGDWLAVPPSDSEEEDDDDEEEEEKDDEVEDVGF